MIHAICWRAILLIRQSDTDSRQLQMLMSLERKHYQRKMYHIFSVPLLLSKKSMQTETIGLSKSSLYYW